MDSKCTVSVVMPVYNGERYIAQAIESILNQTFKDFEFIIVNDGSTDKTQEILKRYQGIKIINQNNQGVSVASNTGISQSSGKYIARLDADDISLPTRLAKQLAYLEEHAEIGILGSGAIIIDGKGKKWGYQKMPETDAEIRWFSIFKSPFIHSSVIFRRELIRNKFNEIYNQNYIPADDYDLWIRLLKTTNAANFPEPLIYYRVHDTNASLIQKQKQYFISTQISQEEYFTKFSCFNTKLSPEEIKAILDLIYSGIRGYKSFGRSRNKIILDYLDTWELYKKVNSLTNNEITAIQKQIIAKTCQMTLFPPFPNDFIEIIARIKAMDKNWYKFFIDTMPYTFWALIRDRYLWKRQ